MRRNKSEKAMEKALEERQKNNYLYDKESGKWVSEYDVIHGGEINEYYDFENLNTPMLEIERGAILYELKSLAEQYGQANVTRVEDLDKGVIKNFMGLKLYPSSKRAHIYAFFALGLTLAQEFSAGGLNEAGAAAVGVSLGASLAEILKMAADGPDKDHVDELLERLEILDEELARREALGLTSELKARNPFTDDENENEAE